MHAYIHTVLGVLDDILIPDEYLKRGKGKKKSCQDDKDKAKTPKNVTKISQETKERKNCQDDKDKAKRQKYVARNISRDKGKKELSR